MSKLLWLTLPKGAHLALYDNELARGLSFEYYKLGIQRAKGITRNFQWRQRMGEVLNKQEVFEILVDAGIQQGGSWQEYEAAKSILGLDRLGPGDVEGYLKVIAEYLEV